MKLLCLCGIIAVLLLLPLTAIAQCRVGETYDSETLSPVFDATGWYLNLDSPLWCSGTLNSLTVQFYDPTADGRYCLFWALWKPMADGSYHRVTNVSGSYCQDLDEGDEDDDDDLHLYSHSFPSNERYPVERGSIIGGYLRNLRPLITVAQTSGPSQPQSPTGVCRVQSGVDQSTSVLNCTPSHIIANQRLNLLLNIDIINCSSLPPPHNGSITYNTDTQYTAVVTYSCSPGYALTGPPNRTCLATGAWSGAAPTCQKVLVCPNIVIPNGNISITTNRSEAGRGGDFGIGAILVFTCYPGFVLSGARVIVCRSDGTWDYSVPTCDNNVTLLPSTLPGSSANGVTSTSGSSSTFMAVNTVHHSLTSTASVSTSNTLMSQNTPIVIVSNSVDLIIDEPIFTTTQLIILIIALGFFVCATVTIVVLVVLIICKKRKTKETQNADSPGIYALIDQNRDSLVYSYAFTDSQQSTQLQNQGRHYEDPVATVHYEVPARAKEDLYIQLQRIKVKKIPLQGIQLKGHIGSGQFGYVHEGVWNGLPVAVKSLKNEATDIDRIKFLQEAAIMGQFKHPNIIELHGLVNEGEDNIKLVVELMPAGDLRKYLQNMRNNDNKVVLAETLLTYCREICSGMLYLSRKGFVHRDLAARNILLAANSQCKIADFGMSRDIEDEGYYIARRGTAIPIKWTAPEALKYRKYSSASDVWSYGCVMYEIWSLGHKPFDHCHNKEVLDKLEKGYRLPPPSGCPYLMYKLMIMCWHPDSNQRATFPEASQFLMEQGNDCLLEIPESEIEAYPTVKQLGSNDIYAGEKMYKDLQNTYVYYSTLQHV